MGNEFCLIVLITHSLVTIVIARALVQEKDGKHPLPQNIVWTFGLACLVWIIISIFTLRWQLTCVDPPDVDESGCGMAWFCFTMPVLFTTGVVFLYSVGYVVWQIVRRRREHDRIDWRDGKSRDFDLHGLIDE